jgi:hypothetical protein
MVSRVVTIVVLATFATASLAGGGAAAGASAVPGAASANAWGKAEEVPGTAALNRGGYAWITSLSCASAGNCSAGGYYTDASVNELPFVVSQKNGVWGKAVEVPGFAALHSVGYAEITSLSCGSAGNCSAGGYYYTAALVNEQAFVVSQKNGVWGKAVEVPGLAALNTGGMAGIYSVSCGSPGNCVAGGSYEVAGESAFGIVQAFVVSEKNGVWGKAAQVPGLAALNQGGSAGIDSVSCRSAGNCSAGGIYADRSGQSQALVVSEKNGVWGKAEALPGIAALNRGGFAFFTSVSCGAAANCTAGGYYTDASAHQRAFVVSQKNGVWGKAVEVPGLAALSRGASAGVESVS